MQDADAVLTTRDRLKGGDDALIVAARAAGQPIFSMKTSSQASMVKALRSLAGIDPSPLSLRDASAVVRQLSKLVLIVCETLCAGCEDAPRVHPPLTHGTWIYMQKNDNITNICNTRMKRGKLQDVSQRKALSVSAAPLIAWQPFSGRKPVAFLRSRATVAD